MSNRSRRQPTPVEQTDDPVDDPVLDIEPTAAATDAATDVELAPASLSDAARDFLLKWLQPYFGAELPSGMLDDVCRAIAAGTQVCLLPAPTRLHFFSDRNRFVADDEEADVTFDTRIIANLNRLLHDGGLGASNA